MNYLSPKATVLCFGNQPSLLMTRQWMLECANYTVLSALSQRDFRAQICRGPIDLILLCQTLKERECAEAASFAREHAPAARCVVLRADPATAQRSFDAVELDVRSSPEEFLGNIARMLPASAQPFSGLAG